MPNQFTSKNNRCPKCFELSRKKTHEAFVQEIYDLVGNEYTILGKYIDSRHKILIKHNCTKCNNYEWEIMPNQFTSKNNRCPICLESKGEKKIFDYLNKNNIEFKTEYRFKDCKDKTYLPFDFAILNEKDEIFKIIEFDGYQHFEPTKFHKCSDEEMFKKFKNTINHDNIKTTYCEENNIPLLSIKYNQIDIIEEILDDFLKDPSRYVTNHFYNMTKEEYYSELYENLENEGEY